jgi:hypothetical protein
MKPSSAMPRDTLALTWRMHVGGPDLGCSIMKSRTPHNAS